MDIGRNQEVSEWVVFCEVDSGGQTLELTWRLPIDAQLGWPGPLRGVADDPLVQLKFHHQTFYFFISIRDPAIMSI